MRVADLVIEHLSLDLADAQEVIQGQRQLTAARLDFTAWLQAELCRAREWTALDVIQAWHAELDRRAKRHKEAA
jgi:hypothetical protein